MTNKLIAISFVFVAIILSSFTLRNNDKIPMSSFNKEFVHFLSYFPNVETPYEIEMSDLKSYKKTYQKLDSTFIASDFLPKGLQNKYIHGRLHIAKRMAPAPVLPVARFYPDNDHIAVIFATIPFRGLHEFLSVHIKVFDLYGNNVSNHELEEARIAGYSPETTEIATINSTGKFVVESFKNVWKEEYVRSEKENNHIVKYEPITKSITTIAKLILTDTRKAIVAKNP